MVTNSESYSPAEPGRPRGLRVFTCGHSFHANFIPQLLNEIATLAGITGHVISGTSMLGGSQAIDHFRVPDQTNLAKKTLQEGRVDVLTLSCFSRPDEGIAQFARFAVAGNAQVRVTVQELWLPEDRWPFDVHQRMFTSTDDFDRTPLSQLRKCQEAYVAAMDQEISSVNAALGKSMVFPVPEGQATLLLRERISLGTATGLRHASELFLDPWGHPAPPLQLLAAYCTFAVVYRSNPQGLPIPPSLAEKGVQSPALNCLLQELAWQAVIQHPMSGVACKKP